MNLKEYQEHIKRWYPTDDKCNSRNWAMGMAGELGEIIQLVYRRTEISVKDLTLELGDFLWYLVSECTEIGIDLEHYSAKENKDELSEYPLHHELITKALEYVDIVKKVEFNGKLGTYPSRRGNLLRLLDLIVWYMWDYGTDLSKVIDSNIKKLTKRYQDTYSDKKSADRIDVNQILKESAKLDHIEIFKKSDNIRPVNHYHTGEVDPYELMKSAKSSGIMYIDVLRGDLIKRSFRLPEKNANIDDQILEAKKIVHQGNLLVEALELLRG